MKEKKQLEDFSLEELELIRDEFSSYDTVEQILNQMNLFIQKKLEDKASINVRFDMAMFESLHVFDPWEMQILRRNHIHNLQELIDCDLESLDGITISTKESLDWARKFYDMRSMIEPQEPEKMKRKGRNERHEKKK